jgi:hypothetical protein
MCLESEPVRLALKIGLSLIAAVLSYRLVEIPGRLVFNCQQYRWAYYGFAGGTLACCVILGIMIRKTNYVNADINDVAGGGIVFPGDKKATSVILMGDSNASMYGKVLKNICTEHGCKLTVLSVAGGDPLPSTAGPQSPLWLASLAVVQEERPDCLILACNWRSWLSDDRGRFSIALRDLTPYIGRLVILDQPPQLPNNANRDSIRLGHRPPFHEDPDMRRQRIEISAFLRRFESDKCTVVDMSSRFLANDYDVRFFDDHGRQLYHDRRHLSGFGAELVRPELEAAVFLPCRDNGAITHID